MKKKFIIFTLCFTLIFSSINYKKSYADSGLISLPMIATVSSLAVGAGIIINNNDNLYNLGRIFYDYIDRHESLTWQTVNAIFLASSSIVGNKVSVKSDFLDIVKGFFDDSFASNNVTLESTFPFYVVYVSTSGYKVSYQIRYFGSCTFDGINTITLYGGGKFYRYMNEQLSSSNTWEGSVNIKTSYTGSVIYSSNNPVIQSCAGVTSLGIPGSITGNFPYNGGYNWDNVNNRKENDSVSLPVPGDLGTLVGQGNTDFWNNADNLVGNGDLSIPSVDNPSIGVDNGVSFPGVSNPSVPDVPGVDSPSVPDEGLWATIKDFIIDLVVPSDTYWTDTWGGLYNNFTSSFPMVDMDGFNDLVTGEKKFPNIDINIMGASGRVVNGDVINSIVDWLRPIIAGFMMLCLMLFNYRKIYKLIRNTEPFGGIAPGTSDFKTGISEYNKESVIKAVDMSAEYQAWKERGGK